MGTTSNILNFTTDVKMTSPFEPEVSNSNKEILLKLYDFKIYLILSKCFDHSKDIAPLCRADIT